MRVCFFSVAMSRSPKQYPDDHARAENAKPESLTLKCCT